MFSEHEWENPKTYFKSTISLTNFQKNFCLSTYQVTAVLWFKIDHAFFGTFWEGQIRIIFADTYCIHIPTLFIQ